MTARDYLTVLRENVRLIVASVIACLLVAAAVTVLMPPTYTSTASFYVVAGSADKSANASDAYNGAQLAKERIKSYTELLAGDRVLGDAAATLPPSVAGLVSDVTASSVDGSVILTLTGEGSSPAEAQAVTAAVADSFVRIVDDLESTGGTRPPAATVQPIQPAAQPTSPTSPSLGLNIGIALFFGVLIGFGLAIGRRALNRSLRSTDEIEALSGVAALGVVPEDRNVTEAYLPDLYSGAGARGRARAEAFRRIRTNVESSNADGKARVLVVTSPGAGDGRSTTACGVAAALAAVGARVLLIDADLRKPAVQSYLGLDPTEGLVGVLNGNVPIQRVVQRLFSSGFDVLAAGETPTRPNELLSSRSLRALLADARSRYDFVVIDSPPVLDVADAISLARHADGAIVVCRWAKTSRDDLASTLADLHSASIRVVGAVLTRTPHKAERAPKQSAIPRQRSVAEPAPQSADGVVAVPVTVEQSQVGALVEPQQTGPFPDVPDDASSSTETVAVNGAVTVPGSKD